MLRVGSSKMLDPTPNTSPETFCKKILKIPQNHTLMGTYDSKVGTLPQCLDSLTLVGVGTWDPM
jgi:hypothetical protein